MGASHDRKSHGPPLPWTRLSSLFLSPKERITLDNASLAARNIGYGNRTKIMTLANNHVI